MEGRDFAPPPHVLAERSPLLHRAAAHTAPQHPGHFQPGKYYPPHLPVPPHSDANLGTSVTKERRCPAELDEPDNEGEPSFKDTTTETTRQSPESSGADKLRRCVKRPQEHTLSFSDGSDTEEESSFKERTTKKTRQSPDSSGADTRECVKRPKEHTPSCSDGSDDEWVPSQKDRTIKNRPQSSGIGTGLMGNSSASFMGTFLASSLGSPPSHPSGPPSSPSSPPYRNGPHSSAPSQLWFPHPHEAPGYSRFSGSLAPTFLPMSPLDHHGNSSVLYGQHRFYDTSKDFYIRSLSSQPHLLSANHSLAPLTRTAHSHPLGSCSRERDPGAGGAAHKSSKEPDVVERGISAGGKEKERCKQEAKERQHHSPPSPVPHQHLHSHHHPQLHSLGPEEDPRHKDDPKHLSACLLTTKTHNGSDPATAARGSLPSCVGPGASILGTGRQRSGGNLCCKEGVSGEMRISESSTDCLRHSAMLGHSHPMPYSIPPPLGLGSAVGGSWLHPTPPHHHHPTHPHPDLYCPPPPAPLTMSSAQDKGLASQVSRDSKVIGPTFVPSVGPLGDKTSGPFQLSNPHCRGIRGGMVEEEGGEGVSKAKASEKTSNGGRIPPPPALPPPPPSTCQRKPSHQQQQHVYGKADKGPDWSLGPHPPHIPQQAQHSHNHQPHSTLTTRSCSLEAAENSSETDAYRPSLPQGAKDGCQAKSSPYASTPPFRDCSHSGPPHRVLSESKASGESGCALQRDSQRVARIHHQQHSSRPESDGQDPELGPSNDSQDKRKPEMEIKALGYSGYQARTLTSWEVQGHKAHPDNERRKAYDSSAQTTSGDHGSHPPFPAYQEPSLGPHGSENSAMKNLMKYSSQQPLLLSQKSPFGGLGSLKQGMANRDMRNERNGGSASCAQQEGKQTLPSRRASSSGESERSERVGRDSGDVQGEGEVRQPPVGIAVAVTRKREPPCRPPDGHATHSRHGRVLPSMKGVGHSMYSLEREVEEERKRVHEEQQALPPLDREREFIFRENKDRVEFARIHPSSSCHGDLTSHLIVPGGSQLGADPSAHAHPAHHHWMPRTGSPSLWMGHSYGLSHALHQNLPPGFSAAMPGPLQPVLSLPQDPSTALVVLPTEPVAHPATHHLDVMEQQGLWPPVYGPRGPASHMQHPSVYSRQFLRQQELYVLQQHQHQQHHRAAQAMDLAHRHSHSQMKPGESTINLDEDPPAPRTPKPAKPFSFPSSTKAPRSSSSPGGCASRLSPCCHSPAPRPHPKSTPCTPCPEPSPAVAAPRSPALSPHNTPHHLPKAAESQDKRGEGQPPQDYPESLEPDLPPGYTYPAISIGYKAGPSPQEVQLAEHADLEAEQAEPAEPAPQPLPLSTMGAEPMCQEVESSTLTTQVEAQVEKIQKVKQLTEVEEEEKEVTCTPASPSPGSCHHPSDSTCLVPDPKMEEPQSDTTSGLSHDHVSVIEAQAQAENVKPIEKGTVNHLQDSNIASNEVQSMKPIEDKHDRSADEACPSPSDSVKLKEVTQPSSPCSPRPEPSSLGNQYPGSCIWSLELLIAATLCATRDAQMASSVMAPASVAPLHHGMELLSELADLERRQHERNTSKESEDQERLTFDLENLATLAAARALELTPPTTNLVPPPRRTLNLRKKCKWTPRHETVCPVKSIMETLDREELAMRVRLAELQRRYKEKQKELAKLQRKHDHQKEDTSRSPARRGPGRPRKRKPTPGPPVPTDTLKRVKSTGAGPGLLAVDEELAGGGDKHRKRKKMSSSTFHHISATQAPCRQRGRPRLLSSKMAQLKQKAKAKRSSRVESMLCHQAKTASGSSTENAHSNKSGGLSDTGITETGTSQNLDGQQKMMRRGRKRSKVSLCPASSHLPPQAPQMLPSVTLTSSRQETTAKDISPLDSEMSDPEEEDDGVYDSEEVPEDIKNLSSKEQLSGPGGPSSSALEMEASQKAKIKKERQRLGSVNMGFAKGVMKDRRKAPCRPGLVSADMIQLEKRPSGLRWREENSLNQSNVLNSIPDTLERTTRRAAIVLGKRRNCWLETVPSQSDDIIWNRKIKNQQAKGRAVSQLLESFTTDEGFRMDDESSFSEGEEEEELEEEEEQQHKNSVLALPNCVLTKEALRDGLKVLISKEDELLYAAYVHTLDLPDIYSIVIEGERGNRPRIYSLEQLLQEAVLDVRLETVETLNDGTRVCAYWSERSRCLYPGYVRRGGPGEEQKEGCVMVEFDDGDRGWISLPNIRLLPPGYQIYCAEPSPALLTSPTRRKRKSSTQEKSTQQTDASSEWHGSTESGKTIAKAKPGRPKSVSLSTKKCLSENVIGSASTILTWPAVAMSRKRPSMDLFQFNGLSRRTQKERETDMFAPLLGSSMATPAKGIFSASFEVDSFSSIANGYTSFGNQQLSSGLSLGHKSTSNVRGKRTGDRKEYLVKLDHEGVTSPKTKNGKALMLLGNAEFESRTGRIEKASGTKGMGELTSHMDYSQSMLPVKDSKRSSSHLLKGSSSIRKQSRSLGLGEYAEYGLNCHSDCHSSYSDLDEDEEEEEDARRAAMRNTGRFLSRLSVSSSSSGSSSSSSSGSLSSSSVCSSDNDSSYSSDEEEASRLLLQGCLSSRHTVLQQQQHPEPPTAPPHHAFSAKSMAVTSPKAMINNGTGKHQRKKDVPSNTMSTTQSKSSKDFPKKQKMSPSERPTNSSSFLPARQLWRWSGNPTQRRGLKGKARKLFYKAIVRGKDTIRVGDCAVFLSSGRPHLPYIGRIESLWESWASNMVVKVKWFYHPEETKLGKRHRDGKHALYQSCHEDENDVQTISHKCQVVSRAEYERLSHMKKPNNNSQDLYYLAGTYDPTSGQLVTAEGVSIIC